MPGFGPQVLPAIGNNIQVTADGNPSRPAGGITLDWSKFTAVTGSDTTYPDGTVVKVGAKGYRYGQVFTRVTATGKYGPYDSAASDGREILSRGRVWIANSSGLEIVPGVATDYPDVLDGGQVFKERILADGAGQPTFANLEAALPLLRYVEP